jgi:hypothetical protein
MAEKLMLYYKYAKDTLGLQGQMKLAAETKIPSTKAAMEPDSPENIALFKKAIEAITGKPAPHL